MSLNKELLEILACPECKGDVTEEGMFLICRNCSLAYPILEGNLPDMLPEDRWELEKAEKANFKHDVKKD